MQSNDSPIITRTYSHQLLKKNNLTKNKNEIYECETIQQTQQHETIIIWTNNYSMIVLFLYLYNHQHAATEATLLDLRKNNNT